MNGIEWLAAELDRMTAERDEQVVVARGPYEIAHHERPPYIETNEFWPEKIVNAPGEPGYDPRDGASSWHG